MTPLVLHLVHGLLPAEKCLSLCGELHEFHSPEKFLFLLSVHVSEIHPGNQCRGAYGQGPAQCRPPQLFTHLLLVILEFDPAVERLGQRAHKPMPPCLPDLPFCLGVLGEPQKGFAKLSIQPKPNSLFQMLTEEDRLVLHDDPLIEGFRDCFVQPLLQHDLHLLRPHRIY